MTNKLHLEQIILITGVNRVGKSTLAKAVVDRSYYTKSKIFPFGEELRKELIRAGFEREYLDTKTEKARRLLRAYGDAVRETNPLHFVNLWTNSVMEWISQQPPYKRKIVLSDDVYHHCEVSAVLNMATKFNITPTIVCVSRENYAPTLEEKLHYDSVRESSQITTMLSKHQNLEEFKEYASKFYTPTDIEKLVNSHIVHVHNDLPHLSEYAIHIYKKILPEILPEGKFQ